MLISGGSLDFLFLGGLLGLAGGCSRGGEVSLEGGLLILLVLVLLALLKITKSLQTCVRGSQARRKLGFR